jgi:hypothetical protein
VLAVIDRARFAGTLDEDGAGRLFRSAFALHPAASGCRALAEWVEAELLPELARGVYGARPPGEPETLVLRAMAGDAVDRAAGLPAFDWEGLEYRADGRRAEFLRLEKVRARQGGVGLGQALRICRSTAAPAAGEDPCGEALGGALTSVVYAAQLGDPEGPALAGEDPSLRHEFGPEPWAVPEEVSGPGAPWHVRGSLLALEVPLARLSLHRLAGDALPEEPPVLVAAHRRCLSLAATLANPRDLADPDRDAIADAVEAGRRRVASLSAGGAEVEAAARDAALEPWRARALEWLLEHEPMARDRFFSLGELIDLGAPGRPSWDAWGVADEIGSGLRPRLPRALPADDASGRPPEPAVASAFVDLGLRVALHLSERRLPATLAPAVVATLLPDLLAEARPLGPDDRLALEAWVHVLTRDRLDDAVAALAAGGPLQQAPGAQEAP